MPLNSRPLNKGAAAVSSANRQIPPVVKRAEGCSVKKSMTSIPQRYVWRSCLRSGARRSSQCWRSTRAMGDGLQELGSWLRDAVIAQQRFAECCRQSFRSRNLLLAGSAKRVNDFVHELRIVCRVYRKGIADLKAQSPSGQVEFEMARILCRLRPAQAPIDPKFGGKRVCPRIRRSGNRSFSMHNGFVAAILGRRKFSLRARSNSGCSLYYGGFFRTLRMQGQLRNPPGV